MKYSSGVFRSTSANQSKDVKTFYVYLTKFVGFFLLLYVGSLLIIGLSSKDNFYSPFVARYLDYVTPLRQAILGSANALVRGLGYRTNFGDKYTLIIAGGRGVRMVYSCVGYGVLSFWAAFVLANQGSFLFKVKWAFVGLAILYVLNVLRISLLVLADAHHWNLPFGIDHHTVFNVVAYGFIFGLMYLYALSKKKRDLSHYEN